MSAPLRRGGAALAMVLTVHTIGSMVSASRVEAVHFGANLLDDNIEGIEQGLGDDDIEGGEGAEEAEVSLADEAGDDWGDAALKESQAMATQRMEEKNIALKEQLQALKLSNARVKVTLGEANNIGSEAEAYQRHIDAQTRLLLRNDRDQQMLAQARVKRSNLRLGEDSPIAGTGDPSSASSGLNIDIQAELRALNVSASKNHLGADLLKDAMETGRDTPSFETAGVLCTKQKFDLVFKDHECFLGSQLGCSKDYNRCQIMKEVKDAKPKWAFIEPEMECDNLQDCVRKRSKAQANADEEKVEEEQNSLQQLATREAWEDVNERKRERKNRNKKARLEAKQALKEADKEGDKMVQVAELFGNAPLPNLKVDKQLARFRDERFQMRKEFDQKEEIFANLKTASPECDAIYQYCGRACDKSDQLDTETDARLAIMNRFTKCHLGCKKHVVTCVMKYVSDTFDEVTTDAMEAKNIADKGALATPS